MGGGSLRRGLGAFERGASGVSITDCAADQAFKAASSAVVLTTDGNGAAPMISETCCAPVLTRSAAPRWTCRSHGALAT